PSAARWYAVRDQTGIGGYGFIRQVALYRGSGRVDCFVQCRRVRRRALVVFSRRFVAPEDLEGPSRRFRPNRYRVTGFGGVGAWRALKRESAALAENRQTSMDGQDISGHPLRAPSFF